MRFNVWALALACVLCVVPGRIAQAQTFNFVCITQNDDDDCELGEMTLSVVVADADVGNPHPPKRVLMTFRNVPLDEDEIDEWLDSAVDLSEHVANRLLPYDELAKATGADVYLDASEDDDEYYEEGDDEDEDDQSASAQIAKRLERRRGAAGKRTRRKRR